MEPEGCLWKRHDVYRIVWFSFGRDDVHGINTMLMELPDVHRINNMLMESSGFFIESLIFQWRALDFVGINLMLMESS